MSTHALELSHPAAKLYGDGYCGHVDSLRNLSAAILVDKERMGANSRSTVGTATDAYSMLLHMADVDNLIGLLDDLVERGHTVVVIEHNLDIVARADWVIDLGPGAGHDGGRVIFEGPPEALAAAEHSLTGQHLRTRVS